jgi:ferredoxin
MDFESFVEGPLLWIVFLVFAAAVIARLAFFFSAVIRSSREKNSKIGYNLSIFARFFGPYHMAVVKKPVYAILRYVFHFCLVVIPVWLAGHVVLWTESGLEWEWMSLPDGLADWMTVVILALALYFLIRRILFREIRIDSSPSDYIIILLTGLPFLTGYFLTHGTVDPVGFLGDHIRTIHVLCGEGMILMAAFLFCGTRMNPRSCTGCAACELACPTGTIESRDEGKFRIFNYSHYQCICCASCVGTCPEGAAELRHEISARRFFQIIPKYEIRAAELQECQRCHGFFAPEPLMDKIGKTFTDEYLNFCPDCRKGNVGNLLHTLSPWHNKPAGRPKKSTGLFIRGE